MVMTKPKEFDFERPAPIADDEDEATHAAIDEGLRDAKAGRAVELQQVRKLMPKWITASTSPKKL
jgi:predicted transcriptional regulator